MAKVYVTSTDHAMIAKIARELIADGMSTRHIRVFSTAQEVFADLPIRTMAHYRSPTSSMTRGGMAGSLLGLLLGLPLMWFGQFGMAPLFVLIIAAGVTGALSQLWLGHGLAAQLYGFDEILRRDEPVMVLSVRRRRIGEVERAIKDRHPEVRVLGTDPQGTPPFP